MSDTGIRVRTRILEIVETFGLDPESAAVSEALKTGELAASEGYDVEVCMDLARQALNRASAA